MATLSGIFQFLRRHTGAIGAPSTLRSGQPFVNEVENVLYMGVGDDGTGASTAQVPVGGKGAFLDLVSPQTVGGAKTFGVSPAVPTPAAGDNSQKVPSTSWVNSALMFLRGSAGASSRTLQDKVSDVLSLRDFGAVLDGLTDDAAACDAARSATKRFGQKITVPSGGIYRSYANPGGYPGPVHYVLEGNCYNTTSVPVIGLGPAYDLVESFLDGGTKWFTRSSSTYKAAGSLTTGCAGAVLRVDGTHDFVGIEFHGDATNGSPIVRNLTSGAVSQLQPGMALISTAFVSGSTISAVDVTNNNITVNSNSAGTANFDFVAAGSSGVAPVLQCNINLPALQLAEYVWGNQTIMTSRAYGGGQHCASSSSIFTPTDALADGKGSRAPTWSHYFENNNQTGTTNQAQVGLENDIYGNGDDNGQVTGGSRLILACNTGKSMQSFGFTGVCASGATTLTNVTSITNLTVGQAISGAGIAAGTTLTGINLSADTVTISTAATAAITGATPLTMVAPRMQCYTGISIGAGADSSFGRMLALNSPFYGPGAIDMTGATSLNGTPALALKAGLSIAFNGQARTLSYTGGVLQYLAANGASVQINDNAGITQNVVGTDFGLLMKGSAAVGIDTSNVTGLQAAIRLASGQKVAWESTNIVTTCWDGTYLRSDYASTNLYKVDGAGNFYVGGLATNNGVSIGTLAPAANIELGGASSTFSFIDFHSQGTVFNDYDVRISSFGGSNSSPGQGILAMYAASVVIGAPLAVNGTLTVSGAVNSQTISAGTTALSIMGASGTKINVDYVGNGNTYLDQNTLFLRTSTGTVYASFSSSYASFSTPVITSGYTVANLPAASSALKGARCHVTDASAPTFLGALTGGGSVITPVFCNGSAWVAG